MKIIVILVAMSIILLSCKSKEPSPKPLTGTWRLISGMVVEKGDTVITDYTQKRSFIKIINNTHFAFFHHDLQKGKDSAAIFSAGGGRYSLNGSEYTEDLEYCTARNWEGNTFKFTVVISNDTLIQSGIEKIEHLGVNRTNIETYMRVK